MHVGECSIERLEYEVEYLPWIPLLCPMDFHVIPLYHNKLLVKSL